MQRSPLSLAALASAAVPGLDPVEVQGVPSREGSQFDIAYVTDTELRQWVVRAPRTDAAGAQMDAALQVLGLLMRRVSFSVPAPKGFVAMKTGGRAAVYPRIPGRTLALAQLPAGPGVAADLGRVLAGLHNVDHRLFEEAGVPVYDAATCRSRRLSDLDRSAATGLVPAGLLAHWEAQLEDVALWRFASTPVHGDLTGGQVLAVFDDEDDASTGRVRGLLGWEDTKVGDPAEDFVALAARCSPEALETILEAYAHGRIDRPDPHLLERARLLGQLAHLTRLGAALALGQRDEVDRHTAALRALDERLGASEAARQAAAERTRAEDVRVAQARVEQVTAAEAAATAAATEAAAADGAAQEEVAAAEADDSSAVAAHGLGGDATVEVGPASLFEDPAEDGEQAAAPGVASGVLEEASASGTDTGSERGSDTGSASGSDVDSDAAGVRDVGAQSMTSHAFSGPVPAAADHTVDVVPGGPVPPLSSDGDADESRGDRGRTTGAHRAPSRWALRHRAGPDPEPQGVEEATVEITPEALARARASAPPPPPPELEEAGVDPFEFDQAEDAEADGSQDRVASAEGDRSTDEDARRG